ncbi:hypothetical protein AB0K74_08065 [Streptomyces sp. NPDC056159]|uniref:hypothetical protein n=1 Tax=Streptomyces sp. NPDC056159 TaxID=3155537 RepID=UPI003433B4EE
MARQVRSSSGLGDEGRSGFRQELTRARNAIRGEIIEWWDSTHSDDPQPTTSREVLILCLKELSQAIRELPEKRLENLRESAEAHARQVWLLDGIERDDIPIVEDAICSAYWSDNSRASWSTIFEDVTDEHPVFFGALTLLSLFIFMWIFFPIVVHEEDFKGFPKQGGLAIGALLVATLVIHGRILAILGLVNSKLFDAWRLIAAISALYFVIQDGWRHSAVDWVTKQGDYVPKYFHVVLKHADVCILYALKGFAALVLIGVVVGFLDDLRYKVGPKEPDDAVTSARILLDLLDLATLSQKAVRQGNNQDEGLRIYLTSPVRLEILRHLERVAQTAEGRWKRSLQVGDEISDGAIANIGDGIAAAARKWKAVAATGGGKLADMNEAFVAALIDAAKGNWELLATETPEKEPLRRKVFRATRHVSALAIMSGTTCVVLFDPFSWFGKPLSPAVSSFVLMFAAIVSVSIDPTIVERLGNASKINGAFGSRK